MFGHKFARPGFSIDEEQEPKGFGMMGPRLGWPRWLIVLAGFSLLITACGDDSPVTATTTPTVAPVETAAPTTTEPRLPAASISEADLPTEWVLTVITDETDVEGGVRLDSTIRLDNEQLIAEGTSDQVVEESQMVQGAVVECLDTTYKEAFLWSATQRGTGELDLGDAGSVTLQFDAVIVTSGHMRGLGSGRGAGARVCGQWTGTYTGVSGILGDAAGTFTAFFPGTTHTSNQVWIFDS